MVFGGAIPTVTGTLTGAFPGTSTKLAPDTAVPIPGAPPTSVLFPAALSGAFPASVVLSDTGAATGQLFRSGEITLPSSPGQLTLLTAVGAIPATAVTAFGASLGGTQLSTPIADWAKLLLGAFLGFGPPEAITITSATITPGTGSLSIAVTGSVTYRFFLFIPFTQTFTLSTTVTIAPSGDGMRTDRIVSVVPAGTTLTLPTTMGTRFSVPFNAFNGTLTDRLEPIINRAILNAVDATLRKCHRCDARRRASSRRARSGSRVPGSALRSCSPTSARQSSRYRARSRCRSHRHPCRTSSGRTRSASSIVPINRRSPARQSR